MARNDAEGRQLTVGDAMNLSRRLRLAVLLLALTCTVGCDQVTKHVARVRLREGLIVALPGGLGELWLAENPGAFLSLGAALPPAVRTGVFTIGTGAGLIALAIYLVARARWSRWTFFGLASVTAGGVSNLIDRVTQAGLVTDFITLRLGPLHTGVFNVADMMVMAGMGLLVLAQWQARTAPRAVASVS